MKAKILIGDLAGRFKVGDVGDLVENNFEKYDYHIELAGGRSYYFYKDEVELFGDVPTEGNEKEK